MFNKKLKEELKEEINQLREQVFGKQDKDTEATRNFWHWSRPSLSKKIESVENKLDKQGRIQDLILNHLKLEYVKLTEENGSTKIKETLRKAKPKKKPKESSYDEDYD